MLSFGDCSQSRRPETHLPDFSKSKPLIFAKAPNTELNMLCGKFFHLRTQLKLPQKYFQSCHLGVATVLRDIDRQHEVGSSRVSMGHATMATDVLRGFMFHDCSIGIVTEWDCGIYIYFCKIKG